MNAAKDGAQRKPAVDVAALARAGVRALTPYQPGKPIEELERELGIRGAIKLASNENPLGPSASAIEAARAALADLARYPDGNGFALKRALAAHLKVPSERITLGNGSNDVLELAARAFAGAGDEVIFSEHAFAVYPIVTAAVGADPVVTPAKDYGHDLAAMRRAVTARTRLVFIANPNNPTGTYLAGDALYEFVKGAPPNVIIVVDEAYFEYVAADNYPNAMVWVDELPNLLVTRTFSKIYGLAGLRIGYGVAGAALTDILNRVRQPFNVNSVALVAAEAALADRAHVARSFEVNRAGLRQLSEGLRKLGVEFIPSVGNFICVNFKRPARPIYDRLLRAGVIVRPVDNYNMPNFLRVTVGRPEENERFLKALESVISQQ